MHIKHTILFATLSVLIGSGCASGQKHFSDAPIAKLDCENIAGVVSTMGDSPYTIQFLNSRDGAVGLYWINYGGEEELKQTVLPGERWAVSTFITHPWVVRNESGECLAFYNSKSNVVIEID